MKKNKMLNTGEVYKKDWWQREAFNRFKPLIEKSIDTSKIINVLDLGCGNGIVTEYLAEIFPNASVLGVDVNTQMISSARKNCNNQNVKFDVLDIKNLESLFNQGMKYDLINANYVLHWLSLDEKHQLFDKMQNIIVPNATLMIGTCQKFPNFLQLLDENIREYLEIPSNVEPYLHYFTTPEWKTFLQDFGFRVEGKYEYLDNHPIMLSEDKTDPDNFLCSWLWGASTGKAAYMHSPEDFSSEFMNRIANLSVKIYGTAKYYKDSPNNNEDMKPAAFLEETLFILAKRL